MTDDIQCTVDGVPVKRGDRVWFWKAGQVRQRALNKTDLGAWWKSMTSKIIYSTEIAAIDGAIADERERLQRARRDAKRAETSIARLTARLRATPAAAPSGEEARSG